MTKPIILLGAGGHAKVVLDALFASEKNVIGVCDPILAKEIGSKWRGVMVLGGDDALTSFSTDEIHLVNGLGALPKQCIRRDLFIRYKLKGFTFTTVCHPSANISPSATLGEGCQVFSGAVINADTVVGDNVILNSNCTVEHDCQIGSHSHISPGSIICGGVKVGMQTHIGAGATVIQNCVVGESSVVAAGSVVIKDLGNQKLNIGAKPKVLDWL